MDDAWLRGTLKAGSTCMRLSRKSRGMQAGTQIACAVCGMIKGVRRSWEAVVKGAETGVVGGKPLEAVREDI